MVQSLRGFFSKAANYVCYYSDVLPVYPSRKVREELEARGWRYEPPKQPVTMLDRMARGSMHTIPMPRVISPEGVDLSEAGDPALIKRYDDEKEQIAKSIYGVDGLLDRMRHSFDVSAEIPSEKVCNAMKAEGWSFEASKEDIEVIPMASLYTISPAFIQPKTIVKTPEGREVRRGEQGITDQRYLDAKKRISAQVHNIQFS